MPRQSHSDRNQEIPSLAKFKSYYSARVEKKEDESSDKIREITSAREP
jgi:hypothetical protein